jgi:hypothetical protein
VCRLSAQACCLFGAESIPAQPGLLLRLCAGLLHSLDSYRFSDSVLPVEHAGLSSIPVTGCCSKARFFFARVRAPASWLVLLPRLSSSRFSVRTIFLHPSLLLVIPLRCQFHLPLEIFTLGTPSTRLCVRLTFRCYLIFTTDHRF